MRHPQNPIRPFDFLVASCVAAIIACGVLYALDYLSSLIFHH